MVSDEKFFAWLDGELEPSEAARVEAEVAADPELAAKAEQHRALRARLTQGFGTIADAPVPEQILRGGGAAAASRSRRFRRGQALARDPLGVDAAVGRHRRDARGRGLRRDHGAAAQRRAGRGRGRPALRGVRARPGTRCAACQRSVGPGAHRPDLPGPLRRDLPDLHRARRKAGWRAAAATAGSCAGCSPRPKGRAAATEWLRAWTRASRRWSIRP